MATAAPNKQNGSNQKMTLEEKPKPGIARTRSTDYVRNAPACDIAALNTLDNRRGKRKHGKTLGSRRSIFGGQDDKTLVPHPVH